MENGTKTSVRTMATGSDSPGLGYTGLTRGAVPITTFQRNGSSPGNLEGPGGGGGWLELGVLPLLRRRHQR